MSVNLADQPAVVQEKRLTRRNFLLGSAATAAAGLAIYSGEFARHELSIVTHNIALANLPDAFHGYRVVQISDIHLDEYTEPFFLSRVIEQVNLLAPDLVLITGDFISDTPLSPNFAYHALFHCADQLRGLTCPRRFAVMGNHDDVLGPVNVRRALDNASIPLLVDQYVPIERDGKRLWLAGVADPVTQAPNLDLAIPARPDGPVLLMCHAPDYADVLRLHSHGRSVDLMLSGHSHGGQIRLPLVGPVILPFMGKKYIEGFFRFGNLQLYVNRGIGTVGMPFRLNCPPEITLFTLTNA